VEERVAALRAPGEIRPGSGNPREIAHGQDADVRIAALAARRSGMGKTGRGHL
jgi:hypothetical protein